jgi:uncharacterized protein YlxW (UPF0749 family)
MGVGNSTESGQREIIKLLQEQNRTLSSELRGMVATLKSMERTVESINRRGRDSSVP